MADNKQIIRKLRKKLRQIEALLRLERDLSQEENSKVKSKDEVRSQLQEILAQSSEEENKSYESKSNQEKRNLSGEIEVEHSRKEATVSASKTPEKSLVKTVKSSPAVKDSNQSNKTNILPNVQEENEQKPTAETNVSTTSTPQSETNIEDEISRPKATAVHQPKDKEQSKTKSLMKTHYSLIELIGHHHHVCAVDCIGDLLVSGGKDTCLKVWNLATAEEHLSIGGHTGTITSIAIVNKLDDSTLSFKEALKKFSKVVTASTDCSICIWNISKGKQVKMIYTYSPVMCMDVNHEMVLSGSDGGKVTLRTLADGNEIASVLESQLCISAVKMIDEERMVSYDCAGHVRIYKLDGEKLKMIWCHNPSTNVGDIDDSSLYANMLFNCLAIKANGALLWTDNGLNVKVCHPKTDEFKKIRNSRNSFCTADAMFYSKEKDLLLVSNFNIDTGHSEINLWSMKDNEKYLGTVDSPLFGHIYSCGSTSYIDQKGHFHQRIYYGGSTLGVIDQIKEASEVENDVLALQRLKHCQKAEDTSFEESDDESDYDDKSISYKSNSNEVSPASWGSWCNII